MDKTDLTFWDFVVEANKESLWCDIEAAIQEWVLSVGSPGTSATYPSSRAIESIKICPFSDDADSPDVKPVEDGGAFGERMFGNIARYAWTIHPEVATDGVSRELLLAFMKEEIFKLECAFDAYLSYEVATNEHYREKCEKLYQMIAQDGEKRNESFAVSTSVLSFNYTDQIAEFFDGGKSGACVNIHGRLGGEIIFGIDGKDCMDNANAVSFTKTYRLMQRGGSQTDRLISTANVVSTANIANLGNAINIIKYYGHSLGKADYSYFQSIFDSINLYESKVVLVFYYPFDSSPDGNAANRWWRTELANLINGLLVNYGATMDNKDHGKNLMHKLLLEGRLIIRGLPV